MKSSQSSKPEKRLSSIFDEAVELDEPLRTLFLERACADEPDLRNEIESLLRAYDSHGVRVRMMFEDLPLASPQPFDKGANERHRTAYLAGRRIEHYRILERLGAGGMGVVYQAYDERLDRTVALKFLPPHLNADPNAKTRFANEAKAASALDHANICTIHDIGETDDGHLYIAMSYYSGETIKEKVSGGPVPDRDAIEWGVQVARGLEKAHAAGIVHRDIKPANLLVTEDGIVKILDFGIAKVGGVDLTKTGATMGTLAYMSPEQVRGEETDQRTDVWSLGAVLYEMVTGSRAFAGDSDAALIYSLLNTEPDLEAVDNPGLRSIIEACLRKDREARLASAGELADALTSVADGLRVSITSPPGRRTRTSAVMIGLATVVAAAIALWTWFVSSPPEGNESAPPERQMLVILPFDNVGDPADQYLADGMVEELSMRLSSIGSIGVISRNTANQYRDTEKTTPEIAAELGVDYVIGGTIRWVRTPDGSERIRIAPYLTRVADDTQVWAETYDRSLVDVLDVQRKVAAGIVNQLATTLSPGQIEQLQIELTNDPDAYKEYLKGMAIIRKASSDSAAYHHAIGHFQTALELDSTFVEAAYRVAELVSSFVFVQSAQRSRVVNPSDPDRGEQLQDWKDTAREAAERARRLAPGSRADLLANAAYSLGVLRDHGAALRLLTRAEELTQDADVLSAVAIIYARTGNVELAHDYLKRAVALDPGNAQMWANLGSISRYLRKFDASLEYYERATAVDSSFLIHCRMAQTQLYADLNTKRARQTLAASPKTEHCHEIDFFDHRFRELIDHYQSPDRDQRAWGEHFYAAESYRQLGLRQKELEAWNAANYLNQFGLVAVREAGKGNRDESLAALEKDRQWYGKEKGMAAINFQKDAAWVYALLGMDDELFGAIEADASGPGWMNRAWLMRPTFDPYRDDPRFQTLMKRYESWETK